MAIQIDSGAKKNVEKVSIRKFAIYYFSFEAKAGSI
jgi:hypothetical protein